MYKGSKADDLLVQQPNKFELFINVEIAGALTINRENDDENTCFSNRLFYDLW